MRCLNCHKNGLPISIEICPGCGVYLPSLLRDVLPPGTLLHDGKYRLDFALGRGGFGITYRGIHLHLEQLVAIKEFYPKDHTFRNETTGFLNAPPARRELYQRGLQRFRREGLILARLDHPGIVRVQDLFEERGTAYLVMELISGETLAERIEAAGRQPLPLDQVESIFTRLVSALDAAHQAGIYHLDIKPENVILAADGRVVLIDFGAARQGFSGGSTQAFTMDYAPPEVLAGDDVGPESDIFELGMLLHEMAAGKPPPNALSRLLKDTWQPVGVGEPWAQLITQAVRIPQEDRPTNVQDWWNGRSLPTLVSTASQLPKSSSNPVRLLEGHHGWVNAVAWCPDGSWLASAGDDGTTRLWDASSGETFNILKAHTGPIETVAWSPDGQWLVSAGSDRSILLWNIVTGDQVPLVEKSSHTIWSAAWSPDGRWLAFARDDGALWLAEMSIRKVVTELEGHTDTAWSAAWSPDGRTLASASGDNTVRVWDPFQGSTLDLFQAHTYNVRSVTWSPDGRWLASASADSTIRLWDTAHQDPVRLLQGHADSVYSVAWSSGGLASAGSDHTVKLWNPTSGQLLHVLEGHTGSVYSVAWRPGHRQLASAGSDAVVRIWEV